MTREMSVKLCQRLASQPATYTLSIFGCSLKGRITCFLFFVFFFAFNGLGRSFVEFHEHLQGWIFFNCFFDVAFWSRFGLGVFASAEEASKEQIKRLKKKKEKAEF